jgi:hypothetical protein
VCLEYKSITRLLPASWEGCKFCNWPGLEYFSFRGLLRDAPCTSLAIVISDGARSTGEVGPAPPTLCPIAKVNTQDDEETNKPSFIIYKLICLFTCVSSVSFHHHGGRGGHPVCGLSESTTEMDSIDESADKGAQVEQ